MSWDDPRLNTYPPHEMALRKITRDERSREASLRKRRRREEKAAEVRAMQLAKRKQPQRETRIDNRKAATV